MEDWWYNAPGKDIYAFMFIIPIGDIMKNCKNCNEMVFKTIKSDDKHNCVVCANKSYDCEENYNSKH